MGCSLYVWAIIAAGYTTVESCCFLALNAFFLFTSCDGHRKLFADIEHYFHNNCLEASNVNCTATSPVNPSAVEGYQYTFMVLHALWIIGGIIILSQLCKKKRTPLGYIMWLVVAVILTLLDTITGIFFILDREDAEEDECKESAMWMILLSFRGVLLYVLNMVCVVIVILTLRRLRTDSTSLGNYIDPPTLPKPESRSKPWKSSAQQPAETIEQRSNNNFLEDPEPIGSEVFNQFDLGNQEAPMDNVPQTSFGSHSPVHGQQGDSLPSGSPNWRKSSPDPHPMTNNDENRMSREDQYPFSYTSDGRSRQDPRSYTNDGRPEQDPWSYRNDGRPEQDPRRTTEQDGQPFERFDLHSERHEDFTRNQFGNGQRYVPPSQARHAYDNPAWTSDGLNKQDEFHRGTTGPMDGPAAPPRAKRNAPNSRKRMAPRPKGTPQEDSNSEEEEEKPKPVPIAPSSFDPRPFSYLNPTFRPTDHADVKAMKTHTADIVKTLDLEMKQLKDKDVISEGSESDTVGVISSFPVRSYLNDSQRRDKVKRSTSLRDQLVKSRKVAAAPHQQSSNGSNTQKKLGSIEESDSRSPASRTRKHRRPDGDSFTKPGRPVTDTNGGQRRPDGRDRDVDRRLQSDRKQDKQKRRDESEYSDDYDDYDSSDDEDEKFGSKPVFITAV